MNDELKPCPFCGSKPILYNGNVTIPENITDGDLMVYWSVKCLKCGTEKNGGLSFYRLTSNETLSLASSHFDGRRRAIDLWNARPATIDSSGTEPEEVSM